MSNYDNGALPEWTWPYTDSYTGPNWSDGKWQASVADGKAPPRSKLDVLSKQHDSVYALDSSGAGRNAADLEYFQGTRSMSYMPRVFGDMVLVGNAIGRGSTENLTFKNVSSVVSDLSSLITSAPKLAVKSIAYLALENYKMGFFLTNNSSKPYKEESNRSINLDDPGWAALLKHANPRKPQMTVDYEPEPPGVDQFSTFAYIGEPEAPVQSSTNESLFRGNDGKLHAGRSRAAFYQFNINERLDRFHKKLYKNKRRKKTRVYCC